MLHDENVHGKVDPEDCETTLGSEGAVVEATWSFVSCPMYLLYHIGHTKWLDIE